MDDHRKPKKKHGKRRRIKPKHEGGGLRWISKYMNGFLATLVIIQYSSFAGVTLSKHACENCNEDGTPEQLLPVINQHEASRVSTSNSSVAKNITTEVTRPLHDSKTNNRSRVLVKLYTAAKWQWASVVVASNTTDIDNQNRRFPVVVTDVGEFVDDQKKIFKLMTERQAINLQNYERRFRLPAQVDNCCQKYWSGDAAKGDASSYKHLSLIVAYCKTPLNWIERYMEGYTVANITIISKCGQPVVGAPKDATIIELPNVGRCDHAYAYWVANWIEEQQQRNQAINYNFADHAFIFLKDTRSNFHLAGMQRSLQEMLRISSSTGFGCGTTLAIYAQKFLSAYTFLNQIKTYNNKITYDNPESVAYGDLEVKQAPFPSDYANVNGWWGHLGVGRLPAYGADYENQTISIKNDASDARDLVQACYGGNFVVRGSNLYRQDLSVWKKLEQGLRRGDNIEESHLQERSWGPLLTDALPTTIRDELLSVKNGQTNTIYVGHLAIKR